VADGPITPQDLELANQLKKVITKIKEEFETAGGNAGHLGGEAAKLNYAFTEIKKHLEDMGEGSQILDEHFTNIWDKQAKFATDAEKTLEVLKLTQKADEERLKALEELKRISTEKFAIDAKLQLFSEEDKKTHALTIQNLDKQLDVLNAQAAEKEKIADINVSGITDEAKINQLLEEEISSQKNLNKEAAKDVVAKERTVKSQGEFGALLENSVKQQLGLVTGAGTFLDHLIDIGAEGGSMPDMLDKAQKTFAKMATKANVLKTTFGKLGEMGTSFGQSIMDINGPWMQLTETDIRFVRTTGALEEYGEEMEKLKETFNGLNYTFAETEKAYQGLFENSLAFSDLEADQRKMMAEHTVVLGRFGVQAETAAKTIDHLSKGFKSTPKEVKELTENITTFARALKVGPNKLMSDLNGNMGMFMRYGKEKGVAMFKQLAVTAKKAGVEMSDLLNVAKQFDTFEGAADSAAKLNYMLGGPLLNSMDLLNATEEERIEMLRNAMAQSGKQFDQLGRFQKDLIAQSMGVGVDVAQKIFNAEDIDKAMEATEGLASQQDKLAKEAERKILLQEREVLAQEAVAAAVAKAGDKVKWMHEKWLEFKKAILPIATIIGGIVFAMQSFYKISLFLNMIKTMWFGVAAAETAAAATGWAAMAPVLAIGAGLVALGLIIYAMQGHWGALFDWLGSAFMGLLGLLKSAFKMILKGMAYLISGVAHALAVPFLGVITLIAEGAGLIGKIISALGFSSVGDKITSVAQSVSPHRVIAAGTNAVLGMIDEFEGGTDNVKRKSGTSIAQVANGQAIITGDSSDGRAKPELTVAPPASSVINNKNLQTLASVVTNMTTLPPTQTPAPPEDLKKEQIINVTLKLDSDVLAKHTRRIATDVLETHMEINI